MKKKHVTRTALTFSIFLMILWGILGTSTSLAWFMNTTPVQKNTFHIGILDLEVSHKVGNTYEPIEGDTSVFNDEALYEPGYVQVVYLKIANNGNIDFDYNLSVIPDLESIVTAPNVYGQPIYLPDYLRFGVVFADTEAQLDSLVATRILAGEIATAKLSTFTTESDMLSAGSEKYAALILCMPEHIGNEANYRGNTPPKVELGITVKATQTGTPQ